ncbi:MAG: GHKL domain-containing protein, partial [Spirochaetia bacterium]|nr:GHKL domain-containing protein [Spirochaetia bacterium]
MGQLIDDLLQLARVSRSEVRRVHVDVSRMSQGIIEELRLEGPGRNVSVTIEPGLHLSADEGLLRIVLVNLISNAWKFTSKTPRAEIRIGQREREGKKVIFIQDNGSGFDMAYADKLFGSFQRLHTESEFPGTGIGLATVYRVVKLHGGGIWANAKVGEGAAFQFTLEDLAF